MNNGKLVSDRKHNTIFNENPYDIETIFESLSAAADNNLELLYIDRLINYMRNCGDDCDITNVSYNILKELKIM